MPSADRFVSFNEGPIARARRHPFGLALGTAAIGALLGGVVVIQALGTPEKVETAGLQPPAATRPAETTGRSASSETPPVQAAVATDATASISTVDCEQQTWPHISKACVEAKARAVRVITTDKATDLAASQPVPAGKHAVASRAPAAAPAPTPALNPTPKMASPSPASAPVVPATTGGSAHAVQPQAPEPASVVANASSQPEAVGNGATKVASKKSKRKQSAREREARMARAAEESGSVRDGGGDKDDAPRAIAHSRDRDSGRAGERWREREYDVPAADGSGQRRRVIVIERTGRSGRGEVVSRSTGSERSYRSDEGFSFFGLRF